MNVARRLRVLVVQRGSLVSATSFSRSVAARLTEPLDFLASRGAVNWLQVHELHVEPQKLRNFDIVILNKNASVVALRIAEQAKALDVPIFYDLDDWTLAFPSYSGAKLNEERVDCVHRLLALADTVTVANQRLLAELRPYRESVELVPNGFYVEKYVTEPTFIESAQPRIAFSNADQLKINSFKDEFFSVLDQLTRKLENLTIDFFGDWSDEIAKFPRISNRGSLRYDEHKRTLLSGGYWFAIVPLGGLEDADAFFFNTCKNPFKYLEYGALGIPGIYSQVPIYETSVHHGVTGILAANTADDWLRAAGDLAASRALRDSIRSQAYRDICNKHHVRFSAQKMLELFTKALDRAVGQR